jgi:hypothetical protein
MKTMREDYAILLTMISAFRDKDIGYPELREFMAGLNIGNELNFKGEWSRVWADWLHVIQHAHPEHKWYEHGCELCDFIENAIENEPRPLTLPNDKQVVKKFFSKKREVGFYIDQPSSFVNARTAEIKKKKGNLFVRNYIFNPAQNLEPFDKIGLERDGVDFDPVSSFTIREHQRSNDVTLDDVVTFIKEEFSDVKIAALLDHYTLI